MHQVLDWLHKSTRTKRSSSAISKQIIRLTSEFRLNSSNVCYCLKVCKAQSQINFILSRVHSSKCTRFQRSNEFQLVYSEPQIAYEIYFFTYRRYDFSLIWDVTKRDGSESSAEGRKLLKGRRKRLVITMAIYV